MHWPQRNQCGTNNKKRRSLNRLPEMTALKFMDVLTSTILIDSDLAKVCEVGTLERARMNAGSDIESAKRVTGTPGREVWIRATSMISGLVVVLGPRSKSQFGMVPREKTLSGLPELIFRLLGESRVENSNTLLSFFELRVRSNKPHQEQVAFY